MKIKNISLHGSDEDVDYATEELKKLDIPISIIGVGKDAVIEVWFPTNSIEISRKSGEIVYRGIERLNPKRYEVYFNRNGIHISDKKRLETISLNA